MKIRVSISTASTVFGLLLAVGFGSVVLTGAYALKELKVGGPLYDRIKLGNDLVADILPPPEYVIEAYLEATLALHEPKSVVDHETKLLRLQKKYDDRKTFWTSSALEPELKAMLVEKSDSEATKFWQILHGDLLPALRAKDAIKANEAYSRLTDVYLEHRSAIDNLVEKANTQNSDLETAAAGRERALSYVVWSVSVLVFLFVITGMVGLVYGVVRPLGRITESMKQVASGVLSVEIPFNGRGDEIGAMAETLAVFKDSAIENARLKSAKLREANDRFDVAINTMSQGLCLFDADKKLVISNPRFREIYGLTEEQSRPGTTFGQILQQNMLKGDRLDHAIDENTDVDAARDRYKFRLHDGRIISIRRATTPEGGWVSTHEDVTEQECAATVLAERLAELVEARNLLEAQKSELIITTEALSIAKDAAEAATRAKSDFLAMMSHEIRSPMAGMMGMIDLLSGTILDQEQQELAGIAQESARSLLMVVNNILDFSKLEAGQVTAEAIDFSIEHSINCVALLLGPKARDRGLTLETSLAEGLPRYLNGDPSRLGQILLNLVGNAIKFTEKGSVAITVSHRALEGDAVEVRIEVTDSGPGISHDVQRSLFKPFTQADTSVSRKYGGTGLGLAICKQLCQAMGGDIEVESEPGRGTTFWFTVRCRVGLEPKEEAPPLAPTIEADGAVPNILVAEDNDILRTLISKLLSKRGFRADLVCNGREAVEAVQSKCYHLVLMDMQMPEMDGITAAKAIRGLSGPNREIPIIALTANALVGQRDICLAAGMNSFLTKPIQPDALYEEIVRWSVNWSATTGGVQTAIQSSQRHPDAPKPHPSGRNK